MAPVPKAEIEQFLREMDFTEGEPGVWTGRITIREIGVMQPFLILVRLVDHAVGVAVDLGLVVDNNHEAVYEYLLEVSGRITLGEFFIGEDNQIRIWAELPCGATNDHYFSREELALMMRVLLDAVRDHYNRILQLIHGGAGREPGGLLGWLRAARERQRAD